MKSSLLIVSVLSVLIALLVANNLVEEYSDSITYIDLGTLFILGLIAGLTVGFLWGNNMSGKPMSE